MPAVIEPDGALQFWRDQLSHHGNPVPLTARTIVLIERGDTHEIRNTGRSLFKTASAYVPLAYRDEETELLAGKR